MQLYQSTTSQTVKDKIAAAGGEESIAKEILDGLTWRLSHNPILGSYVIDKEKNIRLVKSEKRMQNDPTLILLYRILKGDPYYGLELMDLNIIS